MSFLSKLPYLDPADVTADEKEHGDGPDGMLNAFGDKLKELLGYSYGWVTHHYVTKEAIEILKKETPREVIPSSVWEQYNTFTKESSFKKEFPVAHLLCYHYDPNEMIKRGWGFTLSLAHLTQLRHLLVDKRTHCSHKGRYGQFVQHIFMQLYLEDNAPKLVVCILVEGITAYRIERGDEMRAMYFNAEKDDTSMDDGNNNGTTSLRGTAQTEWSRKGKIRSPKRLCMDEKRPADANQQQQQEAATATTGPSFLTKLTEGFRDMYSGGNRADLQQQYAAAASAAAPVTSHVRSMTDVEMEDGGSAYEGDAAVNDRLHDDVWVKHVTVGPSAQCSQSEDIPQGYNPAAGYYYSQQ